MVDGKDEFQYLDNVKLLLNIKDDTLDNVLTFYIDTTIQSILNYCNISDLPSDLNYIVCTMTADTYREVVLTNKTGEVVGNVKKITEGDRTVDFGESSRFKILIDNRVSKVKELNRFRRLFRL